MINQTLNHFAMSPSVNIQRSTMDRNSSYKTTFDSGKLIPFYVDEILPGDTFSMDTALLCRMATPIFPVMDNAFLDVMWFFCPSRLVWQDFEKFLGQSDPNAWENPADYTVPTVSLASDPSSGYELFDYFGIPTDKLGLVGEDVNALPFRIYNLIWNEYFRDENLQEPLLIRTGSGEDMLEDYRILPVCKFHDYFTSALPSPQKGGAVHIPANLSDVSVITHEFGHEYSQYPLLWETTGLQPLSGVYSLNLQNGLSGSAMETAASGSIGDYSTDMVVPTNLYADLSKVTLGTINALRQAVAVQRLLEKDARGGTRMIEILKAHFGVVSPDARLQRPEYLGGKRIPINVNQVIQQSATGSGETPQGNVSGFSKTVDRHNSFTKSFVEPGYLIGLMCVRVQRSYQQGINKMWSRKDRLDFYWPSLANVGEQPIRNKEIFFGDDNLNDGIFGYQEAYADYRYKPSLVTGKFRSNAEGTLDSWHYADYYQSRPYLSADWIVESDTNIDRTIAVPSEPQFIIDMYFQCKATRPMPLYSIPGLMDHY